MTTADTPQQQLQEPRMHRLLLHLTPHQYEQHFFAQYYRVIDIFTCTVIPMFLVAYLVKMPGIQAVAAVWYCTLGVRGYRLVLMLLPSAKRALAYERYRYTLVVIERVLQQLVTTLLLTAGPQEARAQEWLDWMVSTQNMTRFHVKNVVVGGGVIYITLNTFWLPLNIVTQVVLNTAWFCVYSTRVVALIACSMWYFSRGRRWLLWAQWGLEAAVSDAAKGASLLVSLALGGSSSSSGGGGDVPAQGVCALDALPSNQGSAVQACSEPRSPAPLLFFGSLPADAVTAPAGPAPDVASTAGRLSLALATTYMLFVVWFLPLFLSWLLERHLKAKLMRLVANTPPGAHSAAAGRAAAHETSAPPKPLPPRQLLRVLLLSFVACLIAAEVFVGLCVQFPDVLGVLKKLPVVYEAKESSM